MSDKPEALPFAVFDEFGKGADDRVQDHYHAQFQRLHAECERLAKIGAENFSAAVEARDAADAKQAQIDLLMMEFCPQEMTPEQVKTWGESQRAAWETHFGAKSKP